MTTFYSSELTGIASLPVVKPTATQYSGNVCIYQGSITFATQQTTDTIVYGVIPAGSFFLFGIIDADTSTSTATLALGITGNTGKYRAAATFTTINTPTLFGIVAASIATAGLTATETDFITIGTAALPASGNLLIQAFWAQTN